MSYVMEQHADPSRESDYFAPAPRQEQPLAVRMAQVELDQAVSTARAYPRSIERAVRNIRQIATLNKATATECIYVLPRSGKSIRGPSVRFAEIIASQWGNCNVGSRVVAVDTFEKVVIAEGVFWDLETGMKRVAQVRRRISDSKGRLYNDDMIVMAGNAACSIAMREAVLKGVPKGVWRDAYDACESAILGKTRTMEDLRDDAKKMVAEFGVTSEQLCTFLEIEGMKDFTIDHFKTVAAVHAAINSGENTIEDYFGAIPKKPAPVVASEEKPKAVENNPANEQSGRTAAQAKFAAEEKAKAEAAKARMMAAQQASNTPTEERKPEQGERQERTAPAPAAPKPFDFGRLYDNVMEDALECNSIDQAKDFHAENLEKMAQEEPELHKKLMAALDDFAAGE